MELQHSASSKANNLPQLLSTARQSVSRGFFHLTSLRLGLATGTLAMMYPGMAAADGLGATVKNFVEELSTGGTAAVKIGSAALGIGMIAYSVYGLSLGRKADERDYPIGRTVGIGFAGAILLGLLAYAGILNTSFFGTDISNDGIQLVDE